MSENSANKKQKTFHNKSQHYHQKNKKYSLEPGQKGFFATCNFREKDCIRECYNILNEYANELYQPETTSNTEKSEPESEDIDDVLEKEIAAVKTELKSANRRFQNVDTGTSNCIFIKTTLSDPVELGVSIIKDIAEKKSQKTRFLLRLVPIDTVCRASVFDIMEAAGKLFDKHFLVGNKTYSVQFNKRYNNCIDRMEMINKLAELVNEKNCTNKVDLKNAELYIIVEVIKGVCLLSVIPDYLKLRKYNIVELCSKNVSEKSEENKIENVDSSKTNESDNKTINESKIEKDDPIKTNDSEVINEKI